MLPTSWRSTIEQTMNSSRRDGVSVTAHGSSTSARALDVSSCAGTMPSASSASGTTNANRCRISDRLRESHRRGHQQDRERAEHQDRQDQERSEHEADGREQRDVHRAASRTTITAPRDRRIAAAGTTPKQADDRDELDRQEYSARSRDAEQLEDEREHEHERRSRRSPRGNIARSARCRSSSILRIASRGHRLRRLEQQAREHRLRLAVAGIERDRAAGLAHRLGARGRDRRWRGWRRVPGVLGGELAAALEIAVAVEEALDRVGERRARSGSDRRDLGRGRARARVVELGRNVVGGGGRPIARRGQRHLERRDRAGSPACRSRISKRMQPSANTSVR